MLNRSNLTYLLYISSEIKQMHFCWDTDIENYVYFNSVQSSAWFNWGENVSLPSLVMTGARLLFFFFLLQKTLFSLLLLLMLTMFLNLLFLQPIRPLQPSSQPVQYSAVSYPPPLLPVSSTQQYSVVLYLLFISSLHGLIFSGCWPLVGLFVSGVWYQCNDWLAS